jgi:hypothetical protein
MPKASRRVQRDVRVLVDLRDGQSCRRCGKSTHDQPSSVHHRIPRGAGGCALVDRASLLVRVCGDGVQGCHGWIESHRADAEVLGWILPKLNPDIDPENEPIFIHSDGWVLLDDGGGITPCGEPRRDPD